MIFWFGVIAGTAMLFFSVEPFRAIFTEDTTFKRLVSVIAFTIVFVCVILIYLLSFGIIEVAL